MDSQTKYAIYPLILWPLYTTALVLLVRGALVLAFITWLLSVLLATFVLVSTNPDSRKRLIWLAVLFPFWILAFPLFMYAHSQRSARNGRAYFQTLTGISLGLLIAAGVSWALPLNNGKPPEDIETMRIQVDSDTPEAQKNAVMNMLADHPFHAPWWLSNQHAQTVWNPFFRRQQPIQYEIERVDTPDGDFLYLHFYPGDPEKPLLLMLHGLEGSVNSPYITGINHTMHALGWNTVTMEFRFCSGVINNTKRIYHMGETTDVDFVARLLKDRFPENQRYALGVSLGANVLGKWLGEQGEAAQNLLHGAALISSPFNSLISAPDFHKILGGLYVKNFLRTLIPKALAKERQFPGCIDVDKLKNCTDFYTYDTEVTARLHGFVDAYDYWEKVSCYQFLGNIRVPTLLLTSEDDPFNPPETIPKDIADASPWLLPQWTSHGGHVGFINGATPLLAHCWLEEQSARFFVAYAQLNSDG